MSQLTEQQLEQIASRGSGEDVPFLVDAVRRHQHAEDSLRLSVEVAQQDREELRAALLGAQQQLQELREALREIGKIAVEEDAPAGSRVERIRQRADTALGS